MELKHNFKNLKGLNKYRDPNIFKIPTIQPNFSEFQKYTYSQFRLSKIHLNAVIMP
jgi:hypothetical protein